MNLADILALIFLIAFVAARIRERDRLVPRDDARGARLRRCARWSSYLFGFFNVETKQALSLCEKGLTKFAIHFAFLAAGVAYLARRSERFYWRTLGWFAAGFAANAAYGVLQLVATLGGRNLDALVLNPITGGAASINIWGAVGQSSVYRVNALTGDANHLGVMLVVPLLLLTPVYLRLEPGHRLRVPLAVLLGFLLLVELATLSRSGLLGLVAGGLVLAIVYRRLLLTRALLDPARPRSARCSRFIVTRRLDYFSTVFHARLQTNDSSSTLHFQVYDFIPQTIHAHPLFGFGLNTFSVYFEFVTGRTKWGAHSYYVATVVETGLVGTILFALFLVYLFRRLGAARRIGRALAAAGDPIAARVRPARLGADRCTRRDDRRERVLPDDAVLLLLRARPDGPGHARRVRPPTRALKVVVLTTSYPRGPGDVAGLFVADQVEHIRERGVEVRGRLARELPALRDRVRRGRRREPAAQAVPRARAAADARRASRARRDGLPRTRISSMRTGFRRALVAMATRQAVRRPGVGHGRRARASVLRRSRGAFCDGPGS